VVEVGRVDPEAADIAVGGHRRRDAGVHDLVQVPEVSSKAAPGDRGELHGGEVEQGGNAEPERALDRRLEGRVLVVDDVDGGPAHDEAQGDVGATDHAGVGARRGDRPCDAIEVAPRRRAEENDLTRPSVSEVIGHRRATGEVVLAERIDGPQTRQGTLLFFRQAGGVAHASSFAAKTARQNVRVRSLSSPWPSSRRHAWIASRPTSRRDA
jgi:hypothetical protein